MNNGAQKTKYSIHFGSGLIAPAAFKQQLLRFRLSNSLLNILNSTKFWNTFLEIGMDVTT